MSTTRFSLQQASAVVKGEVLYYHFEPYSSEKLGYLGMHELLTVVMRDSECTYFAKTAARSNNAFDKFVFCKEARFFREVVPHMIGTNVWTARCYLAQEDLLVLENLRAAGYHLGNPKILEPAEIRAAVEAVACFHASSLLLEAEAGNTLPNLFPGAFPESYSMNDFNFTYAWMDAGMGVAEAIAEKLNLEVGLVAEAYKLLNKLLQPMDGQQNVLCHRDLWNNNLMFLKEAEEIQCKLVDFQTVVYAFYALDLTQVIYLNSTRAMRQSFEKLWIEHYHSTLQRTLRKHGYKGRIIRLNEVFIDYDIFKITGLVYAVQFRPIALLNKESAVEYTKNNEEFYNYNFKSRKEFVLRIMDADEKYKHLIEESVIELIKYMKAYKNNRN